MQNCTNNSSLTVLSVQWDSHEPFRPHIYRHCKTMHWCRMADRRDVVLRFVHEKNMSSFKTLIICKHDPGQRPTRIISKAGQGSVRCSKENVYQVHAWRHDLRIQALQCLLMYDPHIPLGNILRGMKSKLIMVWLTEWTLRELSCDIRTSPCTATVLTIEW